MLDNLKRYDIILGSNSPRRKELLKGLDIPFEVKTLPDIDESYPSTLAATDTAIYIAQKKAHAYWPLMSPTSLLITADTIVWTFGEILGKPSTPEEAKQMLRKLSNKVHEVITGVCLTTINKQVSFSVSTTVCFNKLCENDIQYYVDKYRPLDKAGAYGIQEWIGYIGIEAINGSYFNVMGLPVQRLYQELKEF